MEFVCRPERLTIETGNSAFTSAYASQSEITIPIAHHDGNYFADQDTITALESENRVAFRYVDNPNGSLGDIAGILSENRRVLGMMPHPERMADPVHGNTEGRILFNSLVSELQTA